MKRCFKIKKENCRKMAYILTFYNVNIINTKMNYVIRINDVFKLVILSGEPPKTPLQSLHKQIDT